MDIENLVLLVPGRLDKPAISVFDVPLKIYGILQAAAANEGVDVRLELQLQMVLDTADLPDISSRSLPVQLVLFQDVLEHIQGGFRSAVHLNDGIAPVAEQINLMVQAFDFPLQVVLQLVIGGLQQFLLLRVFHDVPDTLALGGLQLLLQILQHLRQVIGGLFGLGHLVNFAARSALRRFSMEAEESMTFFTYIFSSSSSLSTRI